MMDEDWLSPLCALLDLLGGELDGRKIAFSNEQIHNYPQYLKEDEKT